MNRITHRIAPVLGAALGLLALSSTVAWGLPEYFESQTFDTSGAAGTAGWTAVNYAFTVPPDSIGFKTTNNTLGSSPGGEGGGEMRRGGRSHYADVTLGPTPASSIKLNQRIESKGEYILTSRSQRNYEFGFQVGLGHFDATPDLTGRNHLLFTINETNNDSPTEFFVLARSFLSDGTFAWQGGTETTTGTAINPNFPTGLTLNQGTPYWYESVWDPTIGNGRHRIEFFDNTNPLSPVSVGVLTATMSAAVRSSAAFGATTLNAFGMYKTFGVPIENDNVASMFMDNVTYTVAPEPSVAVIGVVASMLAMSRRRRT